MAARLGVPVYELRQRITQSEFLDWIEFLQGEEVRDTRTHWYLAQIAAEARRGWVSEPKQVKVSDFILTTAKDEPPKQNSKAIWLAALNVKQNEHGN